MRGLYHALATVFILTLALVADTGTSQAAKMKGGGHGAMMGDMMSQLSPEEQKIAQDVVKRHHEQIVAMHRKIFAKRAELNAVMAQEKFDAAKAKALVKEISAMESDLMQRKLGLFIEMREKGVSYYGTCMVGGRMGPCSMGDGMGSGSSGRGMMMDRSMMGGDMKEPVEE
jgi:zinc resistance-associated protein